MRQQAQWRCDVLAWWRAPRTARFRESCSSTDWGGVVVGERARRRIGAVLAGGVVWTGVDQWRSCAVRSCGGRSERPRTRRGCVAPPANTEAAVAAVNIDAGILVSADLVGHSVVNALIIVSAFANTCSARCSHRRPTPYRPGIVRTGRDGLGPVCGDRFLERSVAPRRPVSGRGSGSSGLGAARPRDDFAGA